VVNTLSAIAEKKKAGSARSDGSRTAAETNRIQLCTSRRLQETRVNFDELAISGRIFHVHVHRLFGMAADAECLVILFPVIIFLRVYMVSMQVFVVRGMTEVNPAFLIFACPVIFCSVTRTDFPEATAIVVQWRSIVGVLWQGGHEIFRVSPEIFIKRESSIDFSAALTIYLAVAFIRQLREAPPAYFQFTYGGVFSAELVNKINLEFAVRACGDHIPL
jgi:hypothetical protein